MLRKRPLQKNKKKKNTPHARYYSYWRERSSLHTCIICLFLLNFFNLFNDTGHLYDLAFSCTCSCAIGRVGACVAPPLSPPLRPKSPTFCIFWPVTLQLSSSPTWCVLWLDWHPETHLVCLLLFPPFFLLNAALEIRVGGTLVWFPAAICQTMFGSLVPTFLWPVWNM